MKRHSVLGGLVSGAIAGGVGTWAMDLITTGVAQGQSPADAEAEKAAQPNGKSSVENLLVWFETMTGMEIEADRRPMALQALHYGLGVGPGALYGVLRGRLPLLASGRGLAYGGLLFAANDEYMNTALGLAGRPEDYPISSHVRGLIGHLALGLVTDAVLDVI